MTKIKQQRSLLLGLLICFIGAVFYCYEFVLRIMPGALQTEITNAFGHISATTFGELSAFYYFAYSPMQLPAGILMDRFGPKKLLTFACLCCTIGSYLFADTSSFWLAGTGRFLVGFGSSFAFVGVLVLALNWLPRRYFSSTAGLVTTLGMLGVMYAEINFTIMSQKVGLSTILSSVSLFGLSLTLMILVIIRDGCESNHAKNKLLTQFIQDVLEVCKSPIVWMIGCIGACLYTSLSVFGELWGKSYLENAHHLTQIEAAKGVAMLFLGWAIGAPIAGFLSDQTRHRLLTLVTGTVGALLCVTIILYCKKLSFFTLAALLLFYGVFSSVEIIVFIMAKEASKTSLSSTVFAATNTIVTLGGVIYQPLVGKLLDITKNIDGFSRKEHIYSSIDYQIALSILPISLIVVLVILFFLIRNKQIAY